MTMEHLFKAVIVEDEPRSSELLQTVLDEYCPEIRVAGIAENVENAYLTINREQPDVVFLDIHIPGGSGFKLLELFPQINFSVIFTTSYDQYAIRAIQFSALDYLLKPINLVELRAAIKRLSEKRSGPLTIYPNQNNLHGDKQRIALPCLDGLMLVGMGEIIYCEGANNYAFFYLLSGEKILVSRTLKDCESLLAGNSFLRVHQSYLINLDFVKKYNKGSGGSIEMVNNAIIPVSERKKIEFLSRLQKL
jgi:two-component system LytT family response regulator